MAPDPPSQIPYNVHPAPSGKSFTLAESDKMPRQILAMDVYPSRLALIENGAERLGLDNIAL